MRQGKPEEAAQEILHKEWVQFSLVSGLPNNSPDTGKQFILEATGNRGF